MYANAPHLEASLPYQPSALLANLLDEILALQSPTGKLEHRHKAARPTADDRQHVASCMLRGVRMAKTSEKSTPKPG